MSILAQALAERYKEYLKPFEGHTQEILDLLAMHPHIGAILDSRVVDHNLDVLDPATGWYIRYEIGWQVCWRLVEGIDLTDEIPVTTFSFPANFASGYPVSRRIGGGLFATSDPRNFSAVASIGLIDTLESNHSRWRFAKSDDIYGGSTNATLVLIAEGVWK